MPPSSINQNNTPSISNVLTQEETTELIAQFEQHQSVEVSRPSQTSPTHQLDSLGNQSGDLQSLLNMIQRLTKELAAARSEIDQLPTTTIQLQNQLNHERLTRNQPTPPVITNTQPSFDIPEPTPTASPWPNPDQAAARILQPPSENQGFKYIYLPMKARVPIGQLRSRLRKLDINNNRILDIHYPDRNVVALLVHNDYTDEFRSHLQRFKVTPKDDFNPCNPKLFRDPQYADASDEELANLAFMHHCNRWISKQTLQENLPSSRRNNEPESDPLYFEDENMSTTDEYKNQDLPSDEACMNDALSLC
ncbi:hypothetical protein G6F43_012606 [Rhizopus delemar]|nr:hypothetical protein G6F43_012606 [Rhizopus delemar]